MLRPAIVFAISLMPSFAMGDYPQFRGPDGTGVTQASDPPLEWENDKNVAWKREIPGSGWSQPIVVKGSVFVTTAVGDKLAKPKDMAAGSRDLASIPGLSRTKGPDINLKWQILCLDINDGSIRWSRTIDEGRPKYPTHPSNTYATETPCADAEKVYAYFGATGMVAALDHAGKTVWNVKVGAYPYSNGFGSGSSLTLFDGLLFLNCFNEEKAFVLALDTRNGQQVWRKDRAKSGSAWATPFVWRNSKRVEIVACGDKLVTAHEPNTGKELWRLAGIDTAFAPSPAADADTLILAASSPFSTSPMYAIRTGAEGDITLTKGEKSNQGVIWSQTKAKVGMASPVAYGGQVYFAADGLLSCYEVATGKRHYSERLPRSKMIAASPIVVGNRILIVDESGRGTWVKTGIAFETMGGGRVSDIMWATPAIAGDALLLRGIDGIYCIRK